TGQVLDDEGTGLLLLPQSLGVVPRGFGTSLAPVIDDTPTSSLLTWVDTVNYDPDSTYATWDSPISVQRVVAHPLPTALPTHDIRATCSLNVVERQLLNFRLTAPTLAGGTTTFSGLNLPRGLLVDPTGIVRWMPDAAQAGVYANVHFEATDGA